MNVIEECKKKVGEEAAKLIQDGMLVGIGTGSTVHYFIQSLIQRYKQGLKIQVIASSNETFQQAQKGGLPFLHSDTVTHLDITVDGADEIDSLKQMIKGGGGALVREKIIASMSQEMIVIVDETKVVTNLGKKKLPVEIIPFAHASTLHKIHKLGYKGQIRCTKPSTPFITDNGNYLLDLELTPGAFVAKEVHEDLIHIPGVVDTGFFFHLAGRVIVGFFDGQVVTRE